MTIWIIFIFLILLFFLPFIPGFVELVKKEDADPLPISMGYIRNPRYFAKSFKQILERATEGFSLGHGIHNVKLSKEETLEITASLNIDDSREIDHLLYIQGNLVSGRDVKINKEVYITGEAWIGPGNIIQALSAEGSVKIGHGTRFYRWLDAKDDMSIKGNCNLGISATSGGKLHLHGNCIFRRLFGRPISTGDSLLSSSDKIATFPPPVKPLSDQLEFIRKNDPKVPPKTIEKSNIVFARDVQIGHHTIIRGDIKAYGKIVLEEDVTIFGNVLADGDIIIGKNAKIMGHLFSQTSIFISEGSFISHPDKIKSIIAKKAIHIDNNVTIYGYVTTEGRGTT